MKTTIFIIAIALLGTATFAKPFKKGNSSEQMARKVVTALKKSSPEAYAALFPTLEEFHQVMDENAVVYGETLQAAKDEFAASYENKIMPGLKESFTQIIREGKEKGIDWSAINYERIEYSAPQGITSAAPFTIVFSSKGTEYRLHIENAFVLHNEWKVGQKVKLM